MAYKYLKKDGDFYDQMNWEAEIEVIPDDEEPDPATRVQVKFQNLSWEMALYNDCSNFQDVIENERSDIYHERLDGHFLVSYDFSSCRVDEKNRITVRGQMYPANQQIGSDHHTDESEILASAILVIRMKHPETDGAIREYLEAAQEKNATYKYLKPDGSLPDNMNWESNIQVIPNAEDPGSLTNTPVQVKFHSLSWDDALYQNGSDFQDLLEEEWSEVYHEKIGGYLLVSYLFSNCRVDPELGITIRGEVHPATKEPGGDYYTNQSQLLASATLVVRMKDPGTDSAIREYLEENI